MSLPARLSMSLIDVLIFFQGGDRYQQAFYEFEEMPVCQSVAEIHLGRLPEAEAALQQVLQEDPGNVEAISNSIVLNTLSGKDASEHIS